MAIDSSSYGSVVEVEYLRQRYTSSGSFDTTSNPTLAAVETWIDNLSDTIDAMLAVHGFDVPVTNPEAKNVLGQIVVGYTVDLVDVANGTGRFYNDERTPGNPLAIINEELSEFLARNASGLERLGAARSDDIPSNILARGTDESGNSTHPLFQREQFGETYVNWDN